MSSVLDKKLHAAIDELNDKQKKAVFGIVQVLRSELKETSGHWQNEDFVAEMNDRYNEYKSGKVKLVSLDEAEKNARAAVLKMKSKKAS